MFETVGPFLSFDKILFFRGLSWAANLAALEIETGDADLLIPALERESPLRVIDGVCS